MLCATALSKNSTPDESPKSVSSESLTSSTSHNNISFDASEGKKKISRGFDETEKRVMSSPRIIQCPHCSFVAVRFQIEILLILLYKPSSA